MTEQCKICVVLCTDHTDGLTFMSRRGFFHGCMHHYVWSVTQAVDFRSYLHEINVVFTDAFNSLPNADEIRIALGIRRVDDPQAKSIIFVGLGDILYPIDNVRIWIYEEDGKWTTRVVLQLSFGLEVEVENQAFTVSTGRWPLLRLDGRRTRLLRAEASTQ